MSEINRTEDTEKILTQRKRNRIIALLTPGTAWLVIFFVLPMLLVFRSSFDTFKNGLVIDQFTYENYGRILSESLYVNVLLKSLATGLFVTLACLVIGYPVAHFIARKAQRRRNLLLLGLIIPFWTSLVVRTYAWKLLLGSNGVMNYYLIQLGIVDSPVKILFSTSAVIIGLVHIFLPFMILPLYASIEKLDSSLEEASQDLGGNRIHTFFKVTLPLTLPGVTTGCMLVFIMTVGSFLTPDVLGGAGDSMISNVIQSEFFGTFNWPFGSALAMSFLGFSLVFVATYNKFFKIDKEGS